MASMAGKVIALTGGASGIGLATAKMLAARGASVSIADVTRQNLDAAAESIRASGGEVATHVVDVRDRVAVRKFIESTKGEFGRLDGCANIAGVFGKCSNVQNIWEVDPEDYKFLMDVNAMGIFNCLGEQLKPGVLQEGASIVNAASVTGLFGLERNSAYCASKHAVVGLTRVSAKEAGNRGIRVNAVAPGIISTPMLAAAVDPKEFENETSFTPIARKGKAEEVASVISFLLSDDSTFVSGSIYNVDGGWNC